MTHLSMDLIDESGTIFHQDNRRTIYLTEDQPLTYHTNKWVYHEMPEFDEWQKDMEMQKTQHEAQGSHHLAFTFPENTELSQTFLDYLEKEGYQLGILEMYAIEAQNLKGDMPKSLDIKWVTHENLNDYLKVYRYFAEEYGTDYADEVIESIKREFESSSKVKRIVAYQDYEPIGSVDIIETTSTIEIDSFGVLASMRNQGIGRAMQAFIANYAEDKPIILVADGEDTAKDMYVKQGYTYISYCYQVLKENL